MSSNLPAAARKQVRAANKILAAMHGTPDPAAPAAPAAPGEPAPAVSVVPFDPNAAPPAVAAPPAAAAPPPAAPAAPPPEDFEQKYRVLSGKYNAEISRLTGMAQALKDENDRLITATRAAPPAPAAPARNPLDSVITAKEREDFGEELINLIDRIATAKSGAELTRLNTELNNLKSSMRVTVKEVVENKQAKVYELLEEQVPNWSVINGSEQFLDWLKIRDIMSGTVRQAALSSAFEAGDAHRVVGIFKRFIEEDARSRSTAAPTPATPTVDPATLLAPASGRGSAGAAPDGQGGRIWSEQEIDDFYSRVQRGRIKPEEKKATEAEIHRAMVEGRIRPRHDMRSIANSV
jgi:hypothetical protein